jgi:hypothetical protein
MNTGREPSLSLSRSEGHQVPVGQEGFTGIDRSEGPLDEALQVLPEQGLQQQVFTPHWHRPRQHHLSPA